MSHPRSSPRLALSASVTALALALPAFSAPAAFAARFYDVAATTGINLTEFTYGLGWGDFNGDGHRDLLSCRHFSPPVIYRGFGNGTFNSSLDPPLFEPGDHH